MSAVLEEQDLLTCRSCGEPRPLNGGYRLITTKPKKRFIDFCVECERLYGTLALYRRFTAYGEQETAQAVFAAERVPKGKRTESQIRLIVEPEPKDTPKTNEELIQRELGRRELAKRRLVFYVKMFQPDYKVSWVHQDICRRLERFVERVERGESPRLMIAMPPRHGKSQLASVHFVSWLLGKHPEWGVIGASYAQSLPIEFSGMIRDALNDPDYQAMFPQTRLKKELIEAWKTTKGGGYIAAGVGVGINGKGMHIGIGDDLLKDEEQAANEEQRAKAYRWYQSTFRTRLAPGGGILLIGTRWHDDDVQGRALTEEELLRKNGVPEAELEQWEVVSYPAVANDDEYLLSDGAIFTGTLPEGEEKARLLRKKGEALHPERYPLAELMKIKHVQGPALWAALYQQNPTPDDGDFFQKRDFRYRVLNKDYLPFCRRFLTFDFAISTRTSKRDWTVGGAWALDHNDDLYLLDVVRGRWGTMAIIEQIVGLVLKWDPEVFAGERGQIYEAIWPILRQELDKLRRYLAFDESLLPVQDKEVRARPLQGRVQRHKVIFSYDTTVRPEIYDDVEKELLRFPNGTNDDIVDMMSWAARLVSKLALPNSPLPKGRPASSWKDRFRNKRLSAMAS